MLLKTDSLIFDLDGTLWDASRSCAMAWNKALEKVNVNDFLVTQQMTFSFAGKLLDDIFSRYFTFLPKERYQELADAYGEAESYHMKTFGGDLYPDAKKQLTLLAEKYPLFIVSNCLSGYIENFLELQQLEDLFADFECSGNTGKPKSDNLALIISRNKLKHPVYIGDTLGDHEASIKNDVPFVYAEYGFGEAPDAEYRINNLTELNSILD